MIILFVWLLFLFQVDSINQELVLKVSKDAGGLRFNVKQGVSQRFTAFVCSPI